MEQFDIDGRQVVVSYEHLPKGWKGWTSPRSWGYIILIASGLDPCESFRQLLSEIREIKKYDSLNDRDKMELKLEAELALNRPELLITIKEEIRNTYELD